ncbi:hypothetical protein EYF80_021050 [Liparis tanakae]|uniref:Uncharacterized protein n=1 Tax=Liparis tanakae TaxID=230148 RepID=A0A4Z2HSJ7_9TELE|nr:hypothetical protein EYF80_021050 [Liparis tanakae]
MKQSRRRERLRAGRVRVLEQSRDRHRRRGEVEGKISHEAPSGHTQEILPERVQQERKSCGLPQWPCCQDRIVLFESSAVG